MSRQVVRGEVLKGHIDSILLAVLQNGAAHGYAIVETVHENTGGEIELPESTIYPALHRLEAAGLLVSSWSTGTGRRRRVYKLTRRGQSKLEKQRQEWKRFVGAMNAVVGKDSDS